MPNERIKNQAQKWKKSISLFALILFLALTPFASASIITGFRQIEYSSGNGELPVNSSTLSLMTANTSRLYITNAGLVGIGTVMLT